MSKVSCCIYHNNNKNKTTFVSLVLETNIVSLVQNKHCLTFSKISHPNYVIWFGTSRPVTISDCIRWSRWWNKYKRWPKDGFFRWWYLILLNSWSFTIFSPSGHLPNLMDGQMAKRWWKNGLWNSSDGLWKFFWFFFRWSDGQKMVETNRDEMRGGQGTKTKFLLDFSTL